MVVRGLHYPDDSGGLDNTRVGIWPPVNRQDMMHVPRGYLSTVRFAIAALVGLMVAAVAPGSLASQEVRPGPTEILASFDWLVGSWIRQTSRGEIEERWALVSAETMEGIAVRTSGGNTLVTERLRLEQFGSEVFYTAKPPENPLPTPFKLIEADGQRFVFQNPTHDFPQTISYTRIGDHGLLVRIEGLDNGQVRGVDFRFTQRSGDASSPQS